MNSRANDRSFDAMKSAEVTMIGCSLLRGCAVI